MNYLEMEYTTLRTEIIKRIELRQNIMLITFVIAGAFLGIVAKSDIAFPVMFYPPIAAGFALLWFYNDYRIRVIGDYIRDRFESNTSLYWKHI